MTRARVPISLCPSCSSPLIERRVNAPLQWCCLSCSQEFEEPRIEMWVFLRVVEVPLGRDHGHLDLGRAVDGEMRFNPSPLEDMGGLFGFSNRVARHLDELVRGYTFDVEQLDRFSFLIMPGTEGNSALLFNAVMAEHEARSPIMLLRIGQAMVAGAEQELVQEIAYALFQQFLEGRSQPAPLNPPPEGSRSHSTSDLTSLSPRCSNCVYLMRGYNLGEPHICNAFHAIATLTDPTECQDYKQKK